MKTKVIQSNFLSGVLDPRAAGRVDADAYNNGLLEGINVELHHLGGISRRRGLQHRARLPGVLARVTSLTATAPNGGTAANANDNSTSTVVTSTTPPGTTNEWVLVHYDLGSQVDVAFADVRDIYTASGSSTQMQIQWSTDNVVWNGTGPSGASNPFDLVDATPRSYRKGGQPARYWRVVRIGTTSLAANLSIGEFSLWTETGVVSPVRLLPFEVTQDRRVLVAVTANSGTIFENGALVGRVYLPFSDTHVQDIDADASEGELIIVHEDYNPLVLFDDGSNNYQVESVAFSAIPQVDFADGSSPAPTSEIQVITLAGSWAQGATFQVGLQGARSGQINFAGDSSAAEQDSTAADIQRQIQKLFTVKGFDGVTVARTGSLQYTVTFAGASADTYELMTVTQLPSGGTATVARTQAGVSRFEDVWSTTRGWPRTIAFFERRLWFGGCRSKRQSLFGSHVVDTLNFELAEGLDDEAVFITLTGQQTNVITAIAAGRYLQVFTTGGEFRYLQRNDEPIKPSDVPKNQTQYGTARVRPVAIDGATVYVHSTRKALRDFKFDYQEDAFNSLALTSLAPHLLNDVKDIAAWNGSDQDELTYVFAVNGDGTAAVMNLRREVDVRALLQWTTQGLFKAVACVRQDIYFAVQRAINGVSATYLEQLQYGYYTDCAVKWTAEPESDIIGGLGHLDGEECRVRADGFTLSRYTPTAGLITVAEGTFSEYEVGLNFNPSATPMPLQTFHASGSDFMDKRRVVKVHCRVKDSFGVLVNGRPLADRFFDITDFEQTPILFSGVQALEETTNWDDTEDKLVTFSQADPQPLNLLAISVQMESN